MPLGLSAKTSCLFTLRICHNKKGDPKAAFVITK
jgi:hypothetical protein